MSNLDKLIALIKESPIVQRYHELQEKVEKNPVLINKYNELVSQQKRMVQAREKKASTYEQHKQTYDALLRDLTNHILMNEYLETIELINEDLILIQNIIENEINTEIE